MNITIPKALEAEIKAILDRKKEQALDSQAGLKHTDRIQYEKHKHQIESKTVEDSIIEMLTGVVVTINVAELKAMKEAEFNSGQEEISKRFIKTDSK
jgi:hypothetical protein